MALDKDNIIDFPADSNSILFKFTEKITEQTYAEIMVLLKYLSNFWRTLEM